MIIKDMLEAKAKRLYKTRTHSMDMKSMNLLVQSIDQNGRIVDVSPRWLDYMGYKKEEIIGKSFVNFLHHDSINVYELEFTHIKQYGYVDNAQIRVVRKDGSIVDMVVNVTAKYNEKGDFQQTFCELKPILSYMSSTESISMLLANEKIHKMVNEIFFNLSLLIIKDNNIIFESMGIFQAIEEVLKEPSVVRDVVIDKGENLPIIEKIKKIAKEDIGIIDSREIGLLQSEDNTYYIFLYLKDTDMPKSKRLVVISFIKKNESLQVWHNSFLALRNFLDSLIDSFKVEKENIYLKKEVMKLQETDGLTTIYNRMKTDEILTKQLENYEKENDKFSVILVDIDHFKDVNGRYGRDVGDIILQEIADTLRKNIRGNDIVGRWGGEEFLIICKQTPLEGALKIAEKLRTQVEKTLYSKDIRVTASFGVSEAEMGMNQKQIIYQVDKALYRAKFEGRNKTCT